MYVQYVTYILLHIPQVVKLQAGIKYAEEDLPNAKVD